MPQQQPDLQTFLADARLADFLPGLLEQGADDLSTLLEAEEQDLLLLCEQAGMRLGHIMRLKAALKRAAAAVPDGESGSQGQGPPDAAIIVPQGPVGAALRKKLPPPVGRQDVSINEDFSINVSFYLKPSAAILDEASALPYKGSIMYNAKKCYVSFPGKYASGWRQLIDRSRHKDSVACVFFNDSEAGLGQHAPNPDRPDHPCYCWQLYGRGKETREPFDGRSLRNCRTFGYLRTMPNGASEQQRQHLNSYVDATGAILLEADATEEDRKQAWREAESVMERKQYCPAWGCKWFSVWKQRVEQALEQEQELVVVYFKGQAGQGEVDWAQLCSVDLWDDVGLGGSQKGEVAWLRANEHAYRKVDVAEFLKGCGGSSCERMYNFLREDRRKEEVRAALRQCLGWLGGCEDVSLGACGPEGSPTLSFCLQGLTIERLQELRDEVLMGTLEMRMGAKVALERGSLRLDCSEFAESYEREVLRLDKLTDHQKEALRKLEEEYPMKAHLKAPAGAGKTFVAVGRTVNTLLKDSAAKVLFICRNEPLCRLFIYWTYLRLGHEAPLARLHILHGPEFDAKARQAVVKAGCLHLECPDAELPSSSFHLVIVDEAHHIYERSLPESVAEHIDEAHRSPSGQLLLLSDLSQSLGRNLAYPQLKEVFLEQVVRSTRTLVDACAAFGLNKETAGVCHHGSRGPCVKTFLFKDGDYESYAEQTASAMLEVVCTFPGLDLHGRVAILVPDATFREELEKELAPCLERKLPQRTFKLDTAVDSLARLRFGVAKRKREGSAEESITLDTVESFDGMEKLIVVGVGLDTAQADGSAAARSLIYRAMSRANLLFLVVNEYVKGGWLQFLALVDLEEERRETGAEIAFGAAGDKIGPPDASAAGNVVVASPAQPVEEESIAPSLANDEESAASAAASTPTTARNATSVNLPQTRAERITQPLFDTSGNDKSIVVLEDEALYNPFQVGHILTRSALRTELDRWAGLLRALEQPDQTRVRELTEAPGTGEAHLRAALRETRQAGPLAQLLEAWPFGHQGRPFREAQDRLKALGQQRYSFL